jgi:putative membrane protein
MTRYFMLIIVAVMLVGIPVFAQNTSQRTATQGSQGKDSFLNRAIEMNQAEVELSRLAQNKSQNPQVKEYAETMIQDHTQAFDKLQSAAGTSQGQPQPQLNKQHQQLLDRLSNLSGTHFDNQYMNAMVRDHKEAVQMFQRESNAGSASGTSQRQKPGTDTDTDAGIASEMLPTLQKHLDKAEQIQRGLAGSSGKTSK